MGNISKKIPSSDSSKENLLWSKFSGTSFLSWDAVSFFRNVGKFEAQQNLNLAFSFPPAVGSSVGTEVQNLALTV